jgi:flagellar basal body-associated protein FliL
MNSTMALTETTTATKRNPVNTILLILFILALLMNGWWVYQWFFASGPNSHSTLTDRNAQLETLLDASKETADSLDLQLELTLTQYKQVMQEVVFLGDERNDLENTISQQKVEIRRLINKSALGDPRALLRAKTEIERLKKDLVHYQVRLDTLQRSNEAFVQIVDSTQKQIAKTAEENKKLESQYEDIKTKAESVQFQAVNVKIEPIRIKRGNPISTSRASKVDHLKISFELRGNEIIESGPKTISVRILGVNTQVLGANNPDLADSDQLVSWQDTIDYDGEPQQIKFKFDQKEAYQKGDHIVEILDKNVVLARISFILN